MTTAGVTPRSTLSRAADRLVHTVALPDPGPIPADAAAFHRSIQVADLLVGTAIMRPEFVLRLRHGHVDLPRAREGGIDVVGLSIATRLPDLRGLYSTPFFWSQGMSTRILSSNISIADALIDRIEGWERASDGKLRIVRLPADFDAADAGTHATAFIGVQGGHALDGDLANLERLQRRGMRMLALSHVMDNALVGSATGIRRTGLTPYGRDVIAECQRLDIVVDLAHMSEVGVRDALPLLQKPFTMSHTGFRALAGQSSPFRNYSQATRNISCELARDIAAAGGVIGVTLSTWLLGGETLDAFGRAVDLALELCGRAKVAIGSDADGALRMLVDATGYPALTAELLRRGHDRETVRAVMGANALGVLRSGGPSGTAPIA